MSRPLLFKAILAFAAIHLVATTTPSLRTTAEQYHEECVQLLIKLSPDQVKTDNGSYLAAVCLLRSYELLAEDYDPNRHLNGAYALSATASLSMDNHSLWKTGFFNYLREDITFSLMNRRVLKTDLAGVDIPDNAIDDEDRLNIAALYLAEAINIVFRKPIDPDRLHKFSARYSLWEAAKPSQSAPYYDSSDETFGPVFPTIRLLRDCHVAVAQYSILVRSLMLEAEPQSDISRKLQHNATRLCGMAFTSDSPAILVNSFGPVSYCGRHVTQRSLQVDLVRRLHGCGKETGWPIQRVISDLEQHWTAD